MNRPDSNERWPGDPKGDPSGETRSAFESRLRAARPRPARFGAEQLVNGVPGEVPASGSTVPGGQNALSRYGWWAIAASWIGGMVMGAAALQILRNSDVRVEQVSDLVPSAVERAGDADWATASPAADLDRTGGPDVGTRSPDVDREREQRVSDRFTSVGSNADTIPAWGDPAYWPDIVMADGPLRAWSVRRTGLTNRHPAMARSETFTADSSPMSSVDSGTVDPTAPTTSTSSVGGTPERPPLTPASYRGQLRHFLEPPGVERL